MEKETYGIRDDAITLFRKDYSFLSNMYSYKTVIEYNGYVFNSVESAYHAQKDPGQSEKFSRIVNPVLAKRKGKTLKTVRKDWDEVKDRIMEDLVFIKFSRNERLRQKLMETGDRQLVEGNDWGDTYWGVSGGVGENRLGEILMKVRERIKPEV